MVDLQWSKAVAVMSWQMDARCGDTAFCATEECQSWLGHAQGWRNRSDLGLGHESLCAWHEAQGGRPHWLFRLKVAASVKRALAAVLRKDWQGPARPGVLPVAEVKLRCRTGARRSAW